MKIKRLNKKLNLNKKTISHLNPIVMRDIFGGADDPIDTSTATLATCLLGTCTCACGTGGGTITAECHETLPDET